MASRSPTNPGHTVQTIMQNARVMRKLPAPSEDWAKRETELTPGEFAMLISNEFVEKTGEEAQFETESGQIATAHIWQTCRQTGEIMKRHGVLSKPESGPACPNCGFGSFVNHGDELLCKECDRLSAKEDWRN